MKDGLVIAVFGISGVGKTSMICGVAGQSSKILHVQASQLLREGIKTAEHDSLRTLSNICILRNQEIIALQFLELRKQIPNKHVIFDGHSVIFNDLSIIPVPVDTIRSISPCHIVFIQDSPEEILNRRRRDISRRRPMRSIEQIADEQATAFQTARGYATDLGIRISLIHFGDHKRLAQIAADTFEIELD